MTITVQKFMQAQQKNIVKTVIILVVVMVTILLLFLNKITTPRYLSDIELKINGLVLLKPVQKRLDKSDQWLLIYDGEDQQAILKEFIPVLRKKFQQKTAAVSMLDIGGASNDLNYDSKDTIGIINGNGELMGYFKPPFDFHKMTLTYSSVIAHR